MSEAAVVAPAVRPRRRRRRYRGVALGAVVVLVVVLAGLVWDEMSVHAVGASKGRERTIAIQPGASVGSVADQLASKGVLSSTLAFSLYSSIHGDPAIHPGWYSFPQGSTIGAIRAILAAPSNTNALAVPAGFTIREVVARLATQMSASFVSEVRTTLHDGSVRSPYQPAGSKDLEGLIAPGRYLIAPTTTAHEVVSAMVRRFTAMASAEGLTPGSTIRGKDAYSVVIESSVVEKEGYQVRNMAKVATVIDNRLTKQMPLQMDSTVLYDLKQDGGPVTRATLQTPSLYNTYLHRGLPPTPICVVSARAIEATLHPTPGPWLYFTVVDKTGTEAFAETFAEQLANEKLAADRGL